jgi:hypothetical protein
MPSLVGPATSATPVATQVQVHITERTDGDGAFRRRRTRGNID